MDPICASILVSIPCLFSQFYVYIIIVYQALCIPSYVSLLFYFYLKFLYYSSLPLLLFFFLLCLIIFESFRNILLCLLLVLLLGHIFVLYLYAPLFLTLWTITLEWIGLYFTTFLLSLYCDFSLSIFSSFHLRLESAFYYFPLFSLFSKSFFNFHLCKNYNVYILLLSRTFGV